MWWFLGETETTREGITADLEAFKEAGVGCVVYYDQVHGKGEGADRDGSERMLMPHIAEAVGYRNLDRGDWSEI